jgi:hypothetical protein
MVSVPSTYRQLLVLLAIAAVFVLRAPAVAEALPPTCDTGCDPIGTTETQRVTRTLNVHVSGGAQAGTVTSPSIGGSAISCTSGDVGTCSLEVTLTRVCTNGSCPAWSNPTVTLTSQASVPGGYAASWDGCDSHPSANTCAVLLDSDRDATYNVVASGAPTLTVSSPWTIGPLTAQYATMSATGGAAPYTFEWKVDGAPPTVAVSSTATTSKLRLGDMPSGRYAVRFQVNAANGYAVFATRNIVVDRTTSVTVTASPPSYWNAGGSPSIAFTHDDDVTGRYCKVDAGSYQACSSPYTPATSLLATDGDHVLTVYVADAVGNTATVSRHVIVDRTAPVVTVRSGPAAGALIGATSVPFSFTVTDANPGSVACALDAAAYAACFDAAPFVAAGLSQGQHTMRVRAVDAAGNVGETSRTFTVDALAPVVTISGKPGNGGATTATWADLAVSADEGTLSCTLDGVVAACGGRYANRTLGEHELVVTAVDTLGHTSVTRFRWTVIAPLKVTRLLVPRVVTARTVAAARLTESITVNSAARVVGRMTVLQRVRVRRHGRWVIVRRNVIVGSRVLRVGARRRVRVVVVLNRAGRAMLARSHRLPVTLTTTITTTAPRQTVRRIARTTFVLPARRRHHR